MLKDFCKKIAIKNKKLQVFLLFTELFGTDTKLIYVRNKWMHPRADLRTFLTQSKKKY